MTLPPNVQQALDTHQKNNQWKADLAEGLTEGGVLIQLATAGSFLYDDKMHTLFIFPHPEQLQPDIIRTPEGYEIRERGFTLPIFEIGFDEIWEGSWDFKNALLTKIKEIHRVQPI